MIVIVRDNDYVEWQGSREEFLATSLPSKGWVEYTGVWPIPQPDPPVVIPTQVSMRQARLQLSVLGLYATVCQAVQSMSEAAQISWEYASVVDRSDTLTQQMIQMIGWTEAQADTYFLEASKL